MTDESAKRLAEMIQKECGGNVENYKKVIDAATEVMSAYFKHMINSPFIKPLPKEEND